MRIAFEIATMLKPIVSGMQMAGYRATVHPLLQPSNGQQPMTPLQTVDTQDPFGQFVDVSNGEYLVRVVAMSADGAEVGESVSATVTVGSGGGNPLPTLFAFPSGLSLTVLPD